MSARARRKWTRFLWPSTLTSQIILLLVFTIFITQAVSLFFVTGERIDAFRRGAAGPFIEQTIIATELLTDSAHKDTDRILQVLTSPTRKATINANARAKPDRQNKLSNRLAARISSETSLTAIVEARFTERRFRRDASEGTENRPRRSAPRNFDRLIVSVELEPGRWLNINWRLPRRENDWVGANLIANIFLALFLTGLAIWVLRRVTRPLRKLSVAAEALGRGEYVPPIEEAGPSEIRQTISSFNAMQERLLRFVKDRTQMLAAISHDLRTPITSLRIRAELLDDEKARDAMVVTLDDMQQMTESVLKFAKNDADIENAEPVDILNLLNECIANSAYVKNLSLSKKSVSAILRARPVALKRAFTNLMENAAIYGEGADIICTVNADEVQILIEDHGSGIPTNLQENMFQPFARGETSRNRETGGTGLGLSIARSIIREHGGDIIIKNRLELDEIKGLTVTVSLPLN